MSFLFRSRVLLTIFVGVFVAGCATYVPPLVGEKSATIQIVQERFMHRVHIVEIDGAKTSSLPPTALLSGPSEMKISPGRHTFLIQGSSGAMSWNMKLWLEAEADHTYYLRSENKGYDFKAWFEESGKVGPVGGALPID
jgi:hypothetical protein